MIVRLVYKKTGSSSDRAVNKNYYDVDTFSEADPLHKLQHRVIAENQIMLRDDQTFWVFYINLDTITVDGLIDHIPRSMALKMWDDVLIAKSEVKLKEFIKLLD